MANLTFMANNVKNVEHEALLKQGVEQWNAWRKTNPHSADLANASFSQKNLVNVNLTGAQLSNAAFFQSNLTGAKLERAVLMGANLFLITLVDADLTGAHLNQVNLSGADLRGAILIDADLRGAMMNRHGDRDGDTDCDLRNANMSGADLSGADLSNADLSGANLTNANLTNANLDNANLTGANLTGAVLSRANLVETNFSKAILTGCKVYGISAWNVILEGTIQNDLVISRDNEPAITVDDLAVAQFIYLMINNKNIRNVLNAITAKGVLILGRFSDPQRKLVLDGLREKLRHLDLLPIVFDFDSPTDKDFTETVQTLAGISMFVIADVTSPRSTPLELEATVKQFKIPFVPILDISVDKYPFSMLKNLQNSFHWVLPTLQYETSDALLDEDNLKQYIIDPVNKKREELRKEKNAEPQAILITKKVVSNPNPPA